MKQRFKFSMPRLNSKITRTRLKARRKILNIVSKVMDYYEKYTKAMFLKY